MKPSIEKLLSLLSSRVKGSEEAAFELVAAILADGHVLIEGPPGVGKTTLAKTFAESVTGEFRRIQFTPDLLPSDLLGYSMFRQDRVEFEFIEGPVFTNLLLADEINRTSPRIQSALLECMNEGQVTIDGISRQLPSMFHVVATQNNRYATGTFPLPEPQLDRFLASIEMRLPRADTQVSMLEYHLQAGANGSEEVHLTTIEDFEHTKEEVREMTVSRQICEYIIRLCEELRKHRELQATLSNRAAIALTRMSQAVAFLNGNPAVFPEDVKQAFIPVLAHRLTGANGEMEARDRSTQRDNVVALLRSVLDQVEVD